MPRLVAFLCAFLAMLLASQASWADGRFEGELVVKPLEDGRNFKVVAAFSFVDSKGRRWDVPEGVTTDGASVPRWAWSIFPPFAGKHLKAAVVHDHFCQTRSKSWQDVHRVFYQAMLASGVTQNSAKTMYAAVYFFGPRWLPDGSRPRSLAPPISDKKALSRIKDMEQWIERTNPSLDEIEGHMHAR